MELRISPPNCSGCGQPATLVPRSTRFRRGDRVLAVDGWIWECASRCPDPADGTVPYQFTTFELMSWEEDRAREAWQARFGEPMPPSRRARLPDEQRSLRVSLLLTPDEAERLDRLRGEMSRSEFLRRAIDDPHGSAG